MTKLVRDGIMEVSAKEFFTFVARAYRSSGPRDDCLVVHIPLDLVRHYQISKRDFLQVAIRKITFEEAQEEFAQKL